VTHLFYSEWCDQRGLDYTDEANRVAYEASCKAEADRPQTKPNPAVSCSMTRTWMDDRAEELRRLSYRIFYKLIFPPPIPIVTFPPLANNEWLGWNGMDWDANSPHALMGSILLGLSTAGELTSRDTG